MFTHKILGDGPVPEADIPLPAYQILFIIITCTNQLASIVTKFLTANFSSALGEGTPR